MITESILDVVFNFLNLLLDFFPTLSFGLDVTVAFTQIASWIAWANYYLPLEDFAIYAGSVLLVWLVCALFSFCLQLF